MTDLTKLNVKIFADGADLDGIKALYGDPLIKGFTTNPTLMHAAGITDYKKFALELLAAISDRPVSFEVFADDFDGMIAQGLEIGSWAPNVNVKIPVTDTSGNFTGDVISALSRAGVHVNVTAVFTLAQVADILEALDNSVPAYISIFAGRIADTGEDPLPVMKEAVSLIKHLPKTELIWASPRELLNVFHAEQVGCQIITVTHDILKKLPGVGKDLAEFSLQTVRMFHDDAQAAGFSIPVAARQVAE